jgi:type II secretory pathway component PulC
VENQNKTAALAVQEEPESIPSFRIIAEKNIFNPERKDFPSPGLTPAEQPKPVVRPQVILSGVIISDDYQAASVSSPGRPLRKGEREAMTLKLGSKIGEYKLAKISADRITFEAGGDSFEVLLYDPRNPKKRIEVKTAIQSSEVKTTQPAPAALPAVETAKAESLKKPVEPAQERVITPASPFASKEAFISRSMRSEAIRQSLRASNQPSTGIVGSTTGNRDESSGLGKMKPE